MIKISQTCVDNPLDIQGPNVVPVYIYVRYISMYINNWSKCLTNRSSFSESYMQTEELLLHKCINLCVYKHAHEYVDLNAPICHEHCGIADFF